MTLPGRSERKRSLVVVALVLGLIAAPALGETNQATGDIAGTADALADSNIVTLSSTGNQLTLVKRAYLPDGTRVPTTSTLPSGSVVDFLIYISNDSTVQINDVSVQDVLDPAFVYQTGTIRVDNSVANCAATVCTPGEEDNLYSVIEPKAPLTDAVDGDVASYSAGTQTIDAGNDSQANFQLNIAGARVWAMAFRVTVP
jgi:uncharacterized repeat protein (TIGR01451 family)